MSTVRVGQKVRDKITGFVGIVIARTEWINQCHRITVQPGIDKDGKVPESYTFDEPQAEILEGGFEPKADRKTGGDQKDPGRGGII